MSVAITIDLSAQTLSVWRNDVLCGVYPVSTAANGAGEIQGSGCTPRGAHVIRAKIGDGLPLNTVFQARRVAAVPLYTPELGVLHPTKDWVLTRILWLSGVERGKNRLGCVDTFRRYIYIHGTPDEKFMGVPASHGCIRMNNSHLIELFEVVKVGTKVTLHE